MPSGQTHDRITIWALPFITGIALWQTRNGNLTLLVAGGFLFGGLMFGPDLDIYSRQYQRWGWFRFIWLPYQKSLRHRSFLSHGPIIGTTLRVLYLCILLGIAIAICLVLAELLGLIGFTWEELGSQVQRSFIVYAIECWSLFLGMELGAMSHSVSDWTNSAYKRFRKQGVRGLLPRGKMKKRKASSSTTRRRKLQAKPKRTRSSVNKTKSSKSSLKKNISNKNSKK
ncbi:MAG: metal-binding protein [Mastigocoleus sp. MO_167.B18]|uniref:metal-binding protein n=1 Tax=Mastigocoleus sp. MO_188.B34 TaxID=3036635 RepID=UPI00260AA4DE|nr:metal-binding protein [Mastigocoleus sp. MO_188.B34]MDJ0693602.1 metal-binding protein [Mastigocoleus sp. MO_188.B34]MDJ0773609.1 metal-binding protein [Mastigocoleus sp. MO_167.B18]